MKIDAFEQTEIINLAKSILLQPLLVNRLSLEAQESFQTIILNITEENSISEMLNNDEWPRAVHSGQIVSSPIEKRVRAEAIIEVFLNNDLQGKKILDFGCGDAHVTLEIAQRQVALAAGYDIKRYDEWNSAAGVNNHLITSSFQDIQNSGPFDYVIVYDVLDHCEDPLLALSQIKSVLATGGEVYVRNHPWCSRHGGHVYRSINKAYAHLFMSDNAVKKLSNNECPCQRLIHPENTYSEWFTKSGFDIKSKINITTDVEPFFMKEPMRSGVTKWWKHSNRPQLAAGRAFPRYQLSQEFIDYSLTAK